MRLIFGTALNPRLKNDDDDDEYDDDRYKYASSGTFITITTLRTLFKCHTPLAMRLTGGTSITVISSLNECSFSPTVAN